MKRRISVPLDEGLIAQLDAFARQVGKPRAWVIEQLVLLASWESLVEAIEEGEVQ